jgi:hypothetical protein
MAGRDRSLPRKSVPAQIRPVLRMQRGKSFLLCASAKKDAHLERLNVVVQFLGCVTCNIVYVLDSIRVVGSSARDS